MPTKTPSDTVPIPSEFVKFMGQLAEMCAFNRSIGQIYGALYFSPKALCLEDIAKICQMSKGNASIHLRTLHDWGAVHRVLHLGTRKDFYRAETNLVELASRRIQEGATKRVRFLRDKIDAFKKEQHFFQDPQQQTYWTERLKEIEGLLVQAEKAYPLIKKYLKLRSMF